MNYRLFSTLVIAASLSICIFANSATADVPTIVIKLKDHKFEPAVVEVPANEKVKIQVVNEDPTAEEFESNSLGREKIVPGNGTISVFIGPLTPGEYDFFGEFNPETAQGKFVVK